MVGVSRTAVDERQRDLLAIDARQPEDRVRRVLIHADAVDGQRAVIVASNGGAGGDAAGNAAVEHQASAIIDDGRHRHRGGSGLVGSGELESFAAFVDLVAKDRRTHEQRAAGRHRDRIAGVIDPARASQVLQVRREVGAVARVPGASTRLRHRQRDQLACGTGNVEHGILRRFVDGGRGHGQ